MKLYVDKQLPYDKEKINLVSEFCAFCADKLNIDGEFEIYVVGERSPHNIQTTAAYQVGKNTCKVFGKHRAMVDVLRSIAHEMTHMMQDQRGMLNGEIQDAGGFHEDQANAKAGEYIKKFAKSSPHRKKIYEARFKYQ